MKKDKIWYWIFTGLLLALMLFSGVSAFLNPQASIDLISTQLGYPKYIIAFLSVAKILAVIAILVPGFPRLKEWAYAGLFFDLAGAFYSGIAIGSPAAGSAFFLIFFVLLFGSYIFYHRKQKVTTTAASAR
ncbi:MAG: DoxX family protein [Bacteroidetes bacterium]|nr:DoxX family protein [Bacteroidota bacterium]